jgi:Fe-S cluster biogenesis protein NfuA
VENPAAIRRADRIDVGRFPESLSLRRACRLLVVLPEIRQLQLSRRAPMAFEHRVEAVLQRIRPMMQADGGDIELVEVQGKTVRVRLIGMCANCPSAHMTLHMGVERALRAEIEDFEELQLV